MYCNDNAKFEHLITEITIFLYSYYVCVCFCTVCPCRLTMFTSTHAEHSFTQSFCAHAMLNYSWFSPWCLLGSFFDYFLHLSPIHYQPTMEQDIAVCIQIEVRATNDSSNVAPFLPSGGGYGGGKPPPSGRSPKDEGRFGRGMMMI